VLKITIGFIYKYTGIVCQVNEQAFLFSGQHTSSPYDTLTFVDFCTRNWYAAINQPERDNTLTAGRRAYYPTITPKMHTH
jgi:hypothetical protein